MSTFRYRKVSFGNELDNEKSLFKFACRLMWGFAVDIDWRSVALKGDQNVNLKKYLDWNKTKTKYRPHSKV